MAVNTRILKAEFEYFTPDNFHKALQLLDQYSPDVKVIAGGTDLLIQMKKEVISPRYLINELHKSKKWMAADWCGDQMA